MGIHFKPEKSSSESLPIRDTPASKKSTRIERFPLSSPTKNNSSLKLKSFHQNHLKNAENVDLILLDRLKPSPFSNEKMEVHPLHYGNRLPQHQTLPIIDLVEINQLHEIDQLKLDFSQLLRPELKKMQKPQLITYNLSFIGIDRDIQVIGNKYIPLKKSEHKDIHRTLLEHGHKIGINSQGLTLIVIEDEIFEKVIEALTHHSLMLTHVPFIQKERAKNKPKGTLKLRSPHLEQATQPIVHVYKKEITKLVTHLLTQELHKIEKDTKKRDQKLFREEQVIKYAIEQYERLQEMVTKESLKKELTKDQFLSLSKKWEESFPPFPIRAVNESVLWRELKPKMIEELLRHFGRL